MVCFKSHLLRLALLFDRMIFTSTYGLLIYHIIWSVAVGSVNDVCSPR